MSNKIQIIRILEPATGDTGIIIMDDYDSDFAFFEVSDNDITLIRDTFSSSHLSEFAEHIAHNKKGVSVDGKYYDYEEFSGCDRFP